MTEKSRSDLFTRIADFYNRLVDQYGHTPRACDYGCADSQITKFRVLSEVMDLAGKRVLDVGCGFADFAGYLFERFDSINYVGIDISPRMIEEAKRLRPNLDVRVCNILDETFREEFDVVTANGIFYLLGDEASHLMHHIIRRFYGLARCAVAFNSLSSWVPVQEPGEFYADPLETLGFCRTLTPWVVLRHDYHPRDFTVYLYKGQSS
jgi:SAM-dependent methyltransferase